ncbi:MAG: DEAD/DEAH box helicase [Candidatus Spechtbacterales bacterium]
MTQRHNNRSSNRSRSHNNNRGSSSRQNYGGGRRRHSAPQNRGGQRQSLNINTFINKAEAIQNTEEKIVPKHKFSDFAIHENLKRAIAARDFTSPTPIQDEAIPHILKGRDIVGIANTGTGKTAAFLIPLIDKILNNPDKRVLIVTPTRELANQIHNDVRKLTPQMGIYSVCCVGGASIGPQLRDLKRRHNFVIGTPGRLKDLIERGNLNLAKTSTIVLDEADRMLDMGFIHDMRYLVARMPEQRHTLFFSATLSKDIEKLVSDFLRDPVTVSVKTQDTSKNVDQDVIRVNGKNAKVDELHNLLLQPEFNKVLVFGRTKHGVEKLSVDLRKRGFKTASIHGNKSYNQRQSALGSFKEDRVRILIATDVASRGLDIPDVSHVINFDIPNTYDDYVHRIGRTGRWGKTGKALTFV